MKIIQRMTYYVCIFGVFILLLMMFLTTSDVIGRSFFRPVTGAFEITKYMLVLVVLSSIAYTQQVKAHVRVPLFISRMPLRAQLVIDSIFTLLAIIFFASLVLPAWEEGLFTLHAGAVSYMLRIPAYPFKLFICLGAFLISLELLLSLITSIKKNIKRDSDKEILL